ncbi:heavy-metal-associated domain-containing protein [Hwangdonia sp.]|uniref:heavy-metal-associated domain-containing protein n=1 Tax=Hwangdonia sp. TaxID=1883432 RepID=UPI003AB218A6
MKKIMILALMLIGTTTFAQNKNQKASIEVDGVCMMCKNRIEKACLTSKGVKSADWNVKTHELKLIYDARKTDLKTIQQTIADVGHDTKEIKASDEAYAKVHACCKYRDDDVIDDHKEDGEEKPKN